MYLYFQAPPAAPGGCVKGAGNLVDENLTCTFCGSSGQPEQMMVCDGCQRGYHGMCSDPKFDAKELLSTLGSSKWFCDACCHKHVIEVSEIKTLIFLC